MRKLILLFFIVSVIHSCSESTSPTEVEFIKVDVFYNEEVLDSLIVSKNDDGLVHPVTYNDKKIGEIEFDIYNFSCDPNTESYRFFTISRKDSFYSYIETFPPYDTLNIDYLLDFTPINDSLNCGTIYSFGVVRNTSFSLWQDTMFIDSLYTDSLGRFQTDITPGVYTLKDHYNDINYETEFELIEVYSDYILIGYDDVVLKPNIYIYPKNEINLDVNISFPKSGKVIKSIPEFPGEWQNLQIRPDGKINSKYDYLFYESSQPKFLQKEKGWIVRKDNLRTFFENNLKNSGFSKSEINDFIDYWIPKLTEAQSYAIYPQYKKELDPLIKLNFSKEPDNIFRLIYVIEERGPEKIHLQPPQIPACKREGFFVMEWGVILD